MKYKYTGVKMGEYRQIVATKDFGNIKKGQIGGYIEKYSNLDQFDDSWLESGMIYGNSFVTGNSIIVDSHISDSYVNYAKITNSRIIKSNIGNDDKVNAIEIKNSTCYDTKIHHDLSNVDTPIVISTLDFGVFYSGFEIVDKKKVHYVSVGCQDHSVQDWLDVNKRTAIMRKNKFPKSREQEFLHYLQAIIVRHCGK